MKEWYIEHDEAVGCADFFAAQDGRTLYVYEDGGSEDAPPAWLVTETPPGNMPPAWPGLVHTAHPSGR